MGIDFSSVSHSLRSTSGGAIRLGHLHEALAAALGYRSYAAYKSSTEEAPSFDGAQHIVLDSNLLAQRMVGLSPTNPAAAVAMGDAIKRAFQARLPNVKVYSDVDDLKSEIYAGVVDAIETSDNYSGEIAMTNAYGGDFDVELEEDYPIQTHQPDWILNASGTSTLEQDPDNVYHGHVINVTARVVFQKLGRRVLGEMDVDEIGAWIQEDLPEEDPTES